MADFLEVGRTIGAEETKAWNGKIEQWLNEIR